LLRSRIFIVRIRTRIPTRIYAQHFMLKNEFMHSISCWKTNLCTAFHAEKQWHLHVATLLKKYQKQNTSGNLLFGSRSGYGGSFDVSF